jgi:hypothetical protein
MSSISLSETNGATKSMTELKIQPKPQQDREGTPCFFSFRISAKMRIEIEELAQQTGHSMSWIVKHFVRVGLDAQQPKDI